MNGAHLSGGHSSRAADPDRASCRHHHQQQQRPWRTGLANKRYGLPTWPSQAGQHGNGAPPLRVTPTPLTAIDRVVAPCMLPDRRILHFAQSPQQAPAPTRAGRSQADVACINGLLIPPASSVAMRLLPGLLLCPAAPSGAFLAVGPLRPPWRCCGSGSPWGRAPCRHCRLAIARCCPAAAAPLSRFCCSGHPATPCAAVGSAAGASGRCNAAGGGRPLPRWRRRR